MTFSALRLFSGALCMAASAAAHADLVIDLGPVSAPATVAFSNSNVTPSSPATPGLYNFLDQVLFSLTATAQVTSLTAAFNFNAGSGTVFGIENLQVNLLDSASNLLSGGWLSVNAGTPFTSLFSATPNTTLPLGNYTLQVRGKVTLPGSYAGTLISAAPSAVPLPATLPLLLAGIGAVGFVARRKRYS